MPSTAADRRLDHLPLAAFAEQDVPALLALLTFETLIRTAKLTLLRYGRGDRADETNGVDGARRDESAPRDDQCTASTTSTTMLSTRAAQAAGRTAPTASARLDAIATAASDA